MKYFSREDEVEVCIKYKASEQNFKFTCFLKHLNIIAWVLEQ